MRESLVTAVRRAVEAVLPWYDPERDALHTLAVRVKAHNATRLADPRLDSYSRISVKTK